MARIIFVGGTGRSGTSIVKEMLARDPAAASLPFEYRFIIDPDGLVDFYTSYAASWSPYMADRRLKRLERFLKGLGEEPATHRFLGSLIRSWNRDGKKLTPRAYHGWELTQHLPNFEHHVDELMSRLVEFSFPACWVGAESYQARHQVYHAPPKSRQELAPILGDFIHAVVNDLLNQDGKQYLVEDNTWNVLFARELLELCPGARILHVYRDPRDVVASFSQQRWSPNDKEQAATWYRSMMDRWFAIRRELDPSSFFEIGLEHLVADPESTIRSVCEFAGIAFHPAMLQIDLSHAHTGRWKQEFSKQEQVRVQKILGDIVEKLGYLPA